MKREEYETIYNLIRQRIIVIPQECLLLRFRDVAAILLDFLDKEEEKE